MSCEFLRPVNDAIVFSSLLVSFYSWPVDEFHFYVKGACAALLFSCKNTENSHKVLEQRVERLIVPGDSPGFPCQK